MGEAESEFLVTVGGSVAIVLAVSVTPWYPYGAESLGEWGVALIALFGVTLAVCSMMTAVMADHGYI